MIGFDGDDETLDNIENDIAYYLKYRDIYDTQIRFDFSKYLRGFVFAHNESFNNTGESDV